MCAAPLKKVPIHLQSSQNRLLIKNGKIVNCDGVVDGEVFIEGGVIKEVGRNLIVPGGTRSIDVRGKYLLPGCIDPNTHFETSLNGVPTVDNFYQGTKAAVVGGTTTVLDFVVPKPDQSLLEAYHDRRQQVEQMACCDYALNVVVTNAGDKSLNEMAELTKENYGVNSFMFFMAHKDAAMLRDPELYKLFEQCRKIGAIAMVHAENGDIITENVRRLIAAGVVGPEGHERSRPEDVEAEAVVRAAMIANQVGCPLYLTNLTSREAVEAVENLNAKENVVYAETSAAALGIDRQLSTWEELAGALTSPPIRTNPSTAGVLLQFLTKNILQVTSSVHRTFSQQQKALGRSNFTLIPDGVNGVEERLSIVWERGFKTGAMDLPQLVNVTSTAAAKLFNLYPRKGAIAVGSDADIVIWEPTSKRTISAKTHHSKSDWNVFEGLQIQGAPEYVIVNGRVCVDEFEVKVVQGHGKFLARSPWAHSVYEDVKRVEDKRGIVRAAIPDVKTPTTAPMQNVAPVLAKVTEPIAPCQPMPPPATARLMRQNDQRDMQSSSFSLSTESPDVVKPSVRVFNPPGGRSSGSLW